MVAFAIPLIDYGLPRSTNALGQAALRHAQATTQIEELHIVLVGHEWEWRAHTAWRLKHR
jgi:hypothetical protein